MKPIAFWLSVLPLACSSDDAPVGNEDVRDDEVVFVPNAPVAVWITTGDRQKLLTREPGVRFQPREQLSDSVISLDLLPTRTYQEIDGFGAAFTDSSAWLIWNRTSPEQREALMRRLFDPIEGAGLSLMRHVVGASDFALSNYTYDDVPEGDVDPELERFSIEHDRAYIIPAMKQALALNPDLKFIGASWSAPAWMKTSGSLIGGSLKPEFYDAAARYLARYTQAFADEGLPIFAVSLQNEPGFAPLEYPGMLVTPEEQAIIIADYLGPLFETLPTWLLLHDHNWDLSMAPLGVLAEPRVRQYIRGTAFHCYGGNVSSQLLVKESFPNEDVWMTECTGLLGSPFDGDLRWLMSNVIIGGTRNAGRGSLMWNLALDERGGPTNGGCQNCRGVVTIHQDTGAVDYNVEYYALAHGSIAARPGAVRIGSAQFAGTIENAAFRNPYGTWGLVAVNASPDRTIPFNVVWGDQGFGYELPPGAAATFRWPMER